MPAPFTSDRILLYNNGVWGQLGYAAPNVGDNVTTVNATIAELVSMVGSNLFAMAHSEDARLRTPPWMNTIVAVDRLCMRIRDILASRTVKMADLRMTATHATPAPVPFLLYPIPFFLESLPNQWMRMWATYALSAVSEMAQHSENERAWDVSEDFSRTVGQYFAKIHRLMAVELLRVPAAEADKPDFVLTDTVLKTYDPSKFFTPTEVVDTVRPSFRIPTEDDLRVLRAGIPATTAAPFLTPYPLGRPEDERDFQPPPANAPSGSAAATAGAATVSAWVK